MSFRKYLPLFLAGILMAASPATVWASRGGTSAGAEASWGEIVPDDAELTYGDSVLAAHTEKADNETPVRTAENDTDAVSETGRAHTKGDTLSEAEENATDNAADNASPAAEGNDAVLLDKLLAHSLSRTAKASKRGSRISVTRYAGQDYCLVFDARYYLRNNPDVDALVDGDYELALKHFVLYGMKQRRQAIATFDVTAYAANYPELREEFGTDWVRYYRHYQTIGKANGYVGTGRTGSKAAAKAAKAARDAEAARIAEEKRAREQAAAEQAAKEAATHAATSINTSLVAASGGAAAFIQAAAQVAEYARIRGMIYGNSSSAVPCEDGRISCDRLIARALWNMGFHDQPAGGVVVQNMGTYLMAHGFTKGTSFSDIRPGSVVVVINNAGTMHCFAVASYNQATNTFVKYDEGSNARIQSKQPFVEPWAYRTLIAVYNWP